jgi:hypothetical protein
VKKNCVHVVEWLFDHLDTLQQKQQAQHGKSSTENKEKQPENDVTALRTHLFGENVRCVCMCVGV